MQVSTAIKGNLEECLEAVAGPVVDLDYTLCTSFFRLFNSYVLHEIGRFGAGAPGADGVLLNGTFLPCSFNIELS